MEMCRTLYCLSKPLLRPSSRLRNTVIFPQSTNRFRSVLSQSRFLEEENEDIEICGSYDLETKYPNLRTGFTGNGNMFQALSKAFIKYHLVKPENIIASNLRQDVAETITENGVRMANSNRALCSQSDVLVIAVKPHILPGVLEEVRDLITSQHLIISIAAGVTIEQMSKMLPEKTRIIRVMPNTPSLVSQGASVCSIGPTARPEDMDLVVDLFSSVGLCEQLPERLLDAVTGVSGSGPAYAFLAIEALSDGGVKMGLPRDKSTKLAAQMLMGAAQMVLETGKHPGELKDAVCSPGGTTIAAVYALEKAGFRSALMSAVEAAATRAKELGNM